MLRWYKGHLHNSKYKQFNSKHDSIVVIYYCRGFIRLAAVEM